MMKSDIKGTAPPSPGQSHFSSLARRFARRQQFCLNELSDLRRPAQRKDIHGLAVTDEQASVRALHPGTLGNPQGEWLQRAESAPVVHGAGQRVQGWAAKSWTLGTSRGAERGAKKRPVPGEQQTSAGWASPGACSQSLVNASSRPLATAGVSAVFRVGNFDSAAYRAPAAACRSSGCVRAGKHHKLFCCALRGGCQQVPELGADS